MNRQATNISTPNRCIWCLREPPNVTFNSDSHVVPECVGNTEQVLPAGFVCDNCNQHYGQKVEPTLLRDPILHLIAVFLRLRDPGDMNEFRDKVFDCEHPPVGSVERDLLCDAKASTAGNLTLNIEYKIKGQLSKSYRYRDLLRLSRAVHKIAFESLAWGVFVKGSYKDIDVFDSRFDAIRNWVRCGQPYRTIRPMLRCQRPDLMKQAKFGYEPHKRGDNLLVMTLNLFGDLYGVSLTSPPDRVEDDLKSWAQKDLNYPVWLMGEKFIALT